MTEERSDHPIVWREGSDGKPTQEPIDEAAALAEMTAKLEAEGLKDSAHISQLAQAKMQENEELAKWLPTQGDTSYAKAPDADCTYPEWMAQQQPAPLAYLRELVQMARDSGMTHIRTGNLEMKFDPDARKPAPDDKRTTF